MLVSGVTGAVTVASSAPIVASAALCCECGSRRRQHLMLGAGMLVLWSTPELAEDLERIRPDVTLLFCSGLLAETAMRRCWRFFHAHFRRTPGHFAHLDEMMAHRHPRAHPRAPNYLIQPMPLACCFCDYGARSRSSLVRPHVSRNSSLKRFSMV